MAANLKSDFAAIWVYDVDARTWESEPAFASNQADVVDVLPELDWQAKRVRGVSAYTTRALAPKTTFVDGPWAAVQNAIEARSSATQAMIPVVEQNNAFLFAPASSSPKLTNISKNFARNWPSDLAEAGSAAQFAKNKFAASTTAILYVKSEYGIGLKDKFSQVYESSGGKIVAAEPYEVGARDFKTVLLKIKAANPEAIYLAGNPKEMGAAIKQLRESGIIAKVVSNTGFLQNDCLTLAGAAADGVVIPTPEYSPAESTNQTAPEIA